MDEIIRLSNFLKDEFSNDSYAYRNTNKELSNIETRIKKLEEKLSNVDNYKKDVKGETFIQELLTQHASNNREENIEEYKGLINLANDEIQTLDNQINAINDNINAKISSLSEIQNEDERNFVQREIRNLSNEKYILRQEVSKLNEDKDYFLSESDRLKAEINEDKMRLEELENSKINQEQLNKDRKELSDLQLESSHLEKYNADLVTLNNFFDIVSKVENNEEYSRENLNNVLEQISDISINQESLNKVNELIIKKRQEQEELKEKISLDANYETSPLISRDVKIERYEKLRKNNEENFELTEKLLDNLETKMEPLTNNRQEQENVLNEISLLSIKFREDSTQDAYYQGEFKKLYARLDALKKEEKNLIVSSDEANYEANKQRLLDRKNRISNDLIHIEKLMQVKTSTKFNRFKKNEDEIKLSLLENEINSLNNIVKLFTKVKEAKDIYGLSKSDGKYIKMVGSSEVSKVKIEEKSKKTEADPLSNLFNVLGIDNNHSKAESLDNENDVNEIDSSTKDSKNDDLDSFLGNLYDSIDNEKENSDENKITLPGIPKDNYDVPGASSQFEKSEGNDIDITDNNESLDYTSNGDVTIVEDVKECKNPKKVKKGIRTRIKAILATVLVGIATLAGCASKKAQDKADSIIKNETSSASDDQVNEYDDVANEILDSISLKTTPSVLSNDIDNNQLSTDKDKDFNIGDSYNVSGDIYETSYDAMNETNGLDRYYPDTDERTISAIEFVSPNGEHVTVTKENKELADLYRSMGFKEVSVCTKNETRDLEYEGWNNLNDSEVVDAKSR